MRTLDGRGLRFQPRKRWWLGIRSGTESEVTAGDFVDTVVNESGSEAFKGCIYDISEYVRSE
jgi:hypothetical protein